MKKVTVWLARAAASAADSRSYSLSEGAGLEEADDEALLDAQTAHPQPIKQPVFELLGPPS